MKRYRIAVSLGETPAGCDQEMIRLSTVVHDVVRIVLYRSRLQWQRMCVRKSGSPNVVQRRFPHTFALLGPCLNLSKVENSMRTLPVS
jgi:hypothetical protein